MPETQFSLRTKIKTELAVLKLYRKAKEVEMDAKGASADEIEEQMIREHALEGTSGHPQWWFRRRVLHR